MPLSQRFANLALAQKIVLLVALMGAMSVGIAAYTLANVRSIDTLYGLVDQYNGLAGAVSGSAEYGVGTWICRSGYASGWRCGTSTATNVTVNYSNGPVYGLRQSTACLTQGDSGGSWLAGNQAQGVSSGGQLNGGSPGSNCSFASPKSYYQRINPLLSAYGLTLVRS